MKIALFLAVPVVLLILVAAVAPEGTPQPAARSARSAARPVQAGTSTTLTKNADGSSSKTLALWRSLSEKQKIDYLIRSVADSGLKFIREGTVYDSKKAAAHLQDKYDYAIKHVKGAKDMTAPIFIKEIASASSLWKTLYYIVLPDGTKVPSGEWLTQRLTELEKDPARAIPTPTPTPTPKGNRKS